MQTVVIAYIAGQFSIRKGAYLASCGDSKRSNGAVKSLLMIFAPGFVCFDVVSDLFVGIEKVSPVGITSHSKLSRREVWMLGLYSPVELEGDFRSDHHMFF